MISNDCFYPPELITCSNSVLQYCTDIHQYVSALFAEFEQVINDYIFDLIHQLF